MKFGTVRYLGICLLFLCAAGCSSYYRITDQATGRTYYTTEYDRTDSGGVVFKDAKNYSKVTLQSSEVREVSKQDFQAARKN